MNDLALSSPGEISHKPVHPFLFTIIVNQQIMAFLIFDFSNIRFEFTIAGFTKRNNNN